jgi:pantoate--beta-alanine ligase
MKVIESVELMKRVAAARRRAGESIGFVPTMGSLHEGHASLVRHARKKCDILVVSIFVNPIQFGPGEDFKKYPRDMRRDKALLSKLDVDYLFVPKAGDMFPKDFSGYVEVPVLSDKLCGKSRPGHFRGVATVVAKLFNIVSPDLAVFGTKDFQQLVIIRKVVRDLSMGVKIFGVKTVREGDGLAMSSRNKYLNRAERGSAAVLYKSLRLAQKLAQSGVRSSTSLIKKMRRLISLSVPRVKIDYIEACDPLTLERKRIIKGKTLIAMAAHVGRARLIDNILIGP